MTRILDEQNWLLRALQTNSNPKQNIHLWKAASTEPTNSQIWHNGIVIMISHRIE